VILAAVLLPCCGKDESGKDDPFGDYQHDETIYYEELDEGALVPLAGRSAAANQLLVILEEDADPEAILPAVIEALSAEKIGQVPDVGLYQLALDAPDGDALLQARATAEALPGVTGATFNTPYAPQQNSRPDYCHVVDDNHNLVGDARCAHTELGYYQAVPMMEKIKEVGQPMHDVRVAVIDTGVETRCGEFDHVDILNLNHRGFWGTDPDGHGTLVASLIAANNEDSGMNGIASRLIGHHLQLVFGRMKGTMSYVAVLNRAIQAKAKIVNMSWGTEFDPGSVWTGALDNLLYTRLFDRAPDTLFVLSAGNESIETTIRNYSPIAITGNSVMVGAHAKCAPDQKASFSNTGETVVLSAAGEGVPVVAFDPSTGKCNDVTYVGGTSFAAPQVAAVAAVIESLVPGLTPQQILTYLTEYGYPGPSGTTWTQVQATLPVAQALIDSGPIAGVSRWIDADEQPGQWDNPSTVVNRICGGAFVEIRDFGTYRFEADDDFASWFNPSMLDTMFSLNDGSGNFSVSVENPLIAIYQEFPIPSPANVSLIFDDGTLGDGIGGAVNYTNCAIIDRDGVTANPLVLELEGVASGELERMSPPDPTIHTHSFTAQFNTHVSVLGATEAQYDSMEANCTGGLEME
jgi:hypothetical protein